MPRSLSRYWLGLVVFAALAIIAFVIVRPGPGFSLSQAATAKDAAPSSLSSASRAGEWSMEGYDPGRTRAVDTTIDLPIAAHRVLNIPQLGEPGSPVAIAKSVMLVEGKNRLRAISLRSGKELWSFAASGTYISPAIANRTVYIRAEAANKGQIIALDLATGKQLWTFAPKRLASASTSFWGGHLTSPVVSEGMVYIGAGKELYALDATSGIVRWEYSSSDYVASSATIGDGRVFFSNATKILALDQRTGTLIWEQPITFAIYFAPVVADNSVYISAGDNILALDATTGAKRWEKAVEHASLRAGGVQGSRLFVKSTSTLYALDTATGHEVWSFAPPAFVSFPILAGTKLFAITGAPGQTRVAVLDIATGKQIDDQRLPMLANTAPVLAGQTIYVRTTDGRIIGLSHE